MDIDWCLTCNKRVDGADAYCSLECQYGAGPSSHRSSFPRPSEALYNAYLDDEVEDCEESCVEDDSNHHRRLHSVEAVSKTNWAGRGSAGIRAWAAEIPLGAQPNDQEPVSAPSDDSSSISSTSSTSSIYRAPNLVRPSRPVPPSLTMSKSGFSITTPPRPILKLHNHLAALSGSQGSTARTSVASEDSLPTPASANGLPFSALPGRPFPSISDARACDLAACTQLNACGLPPATSPPQDSKFAMQSRLPASRITSFPQSSLNDSETSPALWATKSMVARHATQAATPNCRSSVRKDSEVPRGRRVTRVAA